MELASELNRRLKSHDGIGIGMEWKGFGQESELNRNRLLLDLHITGPDLTVACKKLYHMFLVNNSPNTQCRAPKPSPVDFYILVEELVSKFPRTAYISRAIMKKTCLLIFGK